MRRSIDNATAEDLRGGELILATRIAHILAHPNCPEILLDLERSRLARFLAIKIKRLGADE